jgi:hypothetical protein
MRALVCLARRDRFCALDLPNSVFILRARFSRLFLHQDSMVQYTKKTAHESILTLVRDLLAEELE